MNRQHGITTNTYKHLVIDSGAVWMNYGLAGQKCLGATRGGNSFRVEQDIRVMEADGARGDVKGSKRIVKVRPIIEANFIEISTEILQRSLPGSTSTTTTSPATHDVIKRSLEIALADYVSNIAIVGEVNGEAHPVVCIIKNALADGNLELGFADVDETVLKVTFVGHFDPANLDQELWEIRFPIV